MTFACCYQTFCVNNLRFYKNDASTPETVDEVPLVTLLGCPAFPTYMPVLLPAASISPGRVLPTPH